LERRLLPLDVDLATLLRRVLEERLFRAMISSGKKGFS
jgi:hypothetical protein